MVNKLIQSKLRGRIMDSKEVKLIMPEVNDAMAALGRRYPNIIFFAIECKLSDDEFKVKAVEIQKAIHKVLR